MAMIDGQRRRLSEAFAPQLEPGERIEGQLTYCVRRRSGSYVVTALSNLLASQSGFGIVVTSTRVGTARWDFPPTKPEVTGWFPLSEVSFEILKPGLMAGSVNIRHVDGFEVQLFAHRGEADALAELLRGPRSPAPAK